MTDAPAGRSGEMAVALTPSQLVAVAILIVVVMLIRRARKRGCAA